MTFLVWAFGYAVFIYSIVLMVSYLLLAFASYRAIRRDEVTTPDSTAIKHFVSIAEDVPGITMIAPAFNEEVTIVDNIHSFFSLDYPRFEVVVVNDGSTDRTMEYLIENFNLVEVQVNYIQKVPCKPIRRIMRSTDPRYSELTVIDKEPAGRKSDGVNAAINISKYDYFVCTDVDCIFDPMALYRIIWPVLVNRKRIIGVSATMLMSNSSIVKDGKVVSARVPRSLIPRFQHLEYLRSFLIGKMGWYSIGVLPNISGGFGLFEKEVVIAVGGYDTTSIAEDMDIMMRMVNYMYDTNQKFGLVQIPQICCWTEAPETVGQIHRQRVRWARGLCEIVSTHWKMFFNFHYGKMGTILLPYMFFFEFLAPLIEIMGLGYFVWLLLSGAINWETVGMVYLMVYAFAQFITLLVLLLDYVVESTSWADAARGYPRAILVSLLEPIFYHPLITFSSIRGYFNFLSNSGSSWNKLARKGTQKSS